MNASVCFPRNAHDLTAVNAPVDIAEDINPRSLKRRRISAEPASLRRTPFSQLSHTSELSTGYLPSPSASSDGLAAETARTSSYDAPTRHVPPAMDPVLLGGIYDYGGGADGKLDAQQYDRAPTSMSESSGYGPLFGQYWNVVQGSIAQAGVPLAQNGSYVSPYCAPSDPYFPAVQTNSYTPDMVQDMQQNGTENIGDVNSVGESMYNNHHRDSGYESTIVTQETSMYPTQIDASGWQYPAVDPNLHLQSLSLLDSLANQILRDMIATTVQDFIAIAANPDTARGQAYATLQALFEQNKKGFSRDHLFITSSDRPQYSSSPSARTFRKANLATFVSSIFRGHDVPFLELDDAFLDIFMPTGTRLLKSEGALFLELKTQAYIAIMLTSEASKEDVLERLFPRDLQLSILRRRPEPTHLAPSEQDFIGRLNTRRQYLSAGSDTLESLQQLPHKYSWKDFLDEVVISVRRALEGMDAIKDLTATDPVPLTSSISEDPITKATLAAHAAISGHKPNSNTFGVSSSQDMRHNSGPPSIAGTKRNSRGSPVSPTTTPASAPMTVQYEQARASTNPKATPFARRTGAPSQRRPWSQEEEKALMDGLDRVKGPHWSQILALYGAGGSLSEVLKDRNQVQLKDKARNLKLFFLKSGIDVPVYLQRVTGELKTRAPAQAAKREAKERMKALEEERARLGLQPGDPLPPEREQAVLNQRASSA